MEGLGGRKFLLTAGSLLAVFILFGVGYDVTKLEMIVPAILAFYGAHNVAQDWVYRNSNSNRNNNIQSNQPLPPPIILPQPTVLQQNNNGQF